MIGASNCLVIMQLIEGSNQMDYLLVILDFHYCFPSQMIWSCHWLYATLCTRSMIAYACEWMVVSCSWFGFNAIIVTHLLKLTLEFASSPIVKDNKLRSRVTCQPGVMKRILDRCCCLICGFNNFKFQTNQWLYLSLWVQAKKYKVYFGWCHYCKCTHQIH
jgi:hypothetical protein